MRYLALAAALAAFTFTGASAQTTGTTAVGNMTPNTTGAAPAASGNNNQAVATTSANALTPAKGANSFTMGQAANRIASHGYTDVTGLKKDANGVWRGQAKKGGQQVGVWLDYKGNVGQQ